MVRVSSSVEIPGGLRQGREVFRVVLNDDACVEVAYERFNAVHRSQRIRAVRIEGRDTLIPPVIAGVIKVATKNDRPGIGQADQQYVVAGRVTRSFQQCHGAITEDVVIAVNQDLFAVGRGSNIVLFDEGVGLGQGCLHFLGVDQPRGVSESVGITSVVKMKMRETDVIDPGDADTLKLRGEALVDLQDRISFGLDCAFPRQVISQTGIP